jgi:hypothetical protein|tara:strand:+ start:15483 stop:15692 length:210 start_codon:yes stop_codon:yes gene_type:complete
MQIHWEHPSLEVTVILYYEPGTRGDPPCAEIDKIYANGRFPEKDISWLFNQDHIMDQFWDIRPDLECML